MRPTDPGLETRHGMPGLRETRRVLREFLFSPSLAINGLCFIRGKVIGDGFDILATIALRPRPVLSIDILNRQVFRVSVVCIKGYAFGKRRLFHERKAIFKPFVLAGEMSLISFMRSFVRTYSFYEYE